MRRHRHERHNASRRRCRHFATHQEPHSARPQDSRALPPHDARRRRCGALRQSPGNPALQAGRIGQRSRVGSLAEVQGRHTRCRASPRPRPRNRRRRRHRCERKFIRSHFHRRHLLQTSRPRRRFPSHRLRLLRGLRSRWCLLHGLRRSHHEGRLGQNRRRSSSPTRHLCGLTGGLFQRYLHRQSRRARSRPSFRQAHPRHRRPRPPRPPRQSRLRLQHPPHGLRLRRPRRHLHHRRLARLFFLVAASSPRHLVLLLCCPHSFSSLSTGLCPLFSATHSTPHCQLSTAARSSAACCIILRRSAQERIL